MGVQKGGGKMGRHPAFGVLIGIPIFGFLNFIFYDIFGFILLCPLWWDSCGRLVG